MFVKSVRKKTCSIKVYSTFTGSCNYTPNCMLWVWNFLHYHLLNNKSLRIFLIFKLIQHKNDYPNGFEKKYCWYHYINIIFSNCTLSKGLIIIIISHTYHKHVKFFNCCISRILVERVNDFRCFSQNYSINNLSQISQCLLYSPSSSQHMACWLLFSAIICLVINF